MNRLPRLQGLKQSTGNKSLKFEFLSGWNLDFRFPFIYTAVGT